MTTETDPGMEELKNGTYMEITLSYDYGILLSMTDGAELIKLLASAIPIKRAYEKPPELHCASQYPGFKLTTGASIKKERLEFLLKKES